MNTQLPSHANTSEQLQSYEENGYFVVPHLFSGEEVARMLAECDAILAGEYGDLYAGAFQTDPGSTSELKAERKVSAVVERSVVFRKHLFKPELVARLQELLGPDITLFRDILMLKPARVGSKMPWHQDSNYWRVEPASLCSVWTALDPATIENGCMRVIPGSHKLPLIASRLAGGKGPLEDNQVDLNAAVDVVMEPGSSLFFHSRLLHGSKANHSPLPRRAFIVSLMNSQSRQLEAGPGIRTRYFQVSGRSYPGCVQSS